MAPKPGTASSGIRGAYETFGVQGFYEAHGQVYSNPHNDQIVKAMAELMSSRQFGEQAGEQLRVLDLACGSGEATLALQAWASSAQQQQQQQHQQHRQGPGHSNRKRHGQQRDAGNTACCVPRLLDITACDPYTHEAYLRRTGCAAQRWSFQDIAEGCLAGG